MPCGRAASPWACSAPICACCPIPAISPACSACRRTGRARPWTSPPCSATWPTPAGLGSSGPPFALQCRTADGRLLDLAAEALSDGGWSLAVIDVTAAHAAAEALREARETAEAGARAKARFLATMNHELRTPLNAVIGFAETLAHDAARPGPGPTRKETEEFALHIRDAGRHLLTLIDDILDLVRLDSGAYELAADTVDVGRLVQAARARRRKRRRRRPGVTLTGHDRRPAGTGGTRLRADERRLRRLLGHLLGNAMKFTRRGGSVSVDRPAATRPATVRIEVRDTGVGMAPEDLQRVLQPFHQLDTSLARRAGGAGIGLHLSRAIAEAHGGALLLESSPGPRHHRHAARCRARG